MGDRAGLRRDLRRQRQALDPIARGDAALAIAAHLTNTLLIRRYTRIAGYVAADAEADPGPFLAAARSHGRQIFLPVLDSRDSTGLRFVRTEAGQTLYPNRFGIPEPRSGPALDGRLMDLVLVPLVGVDDRGNRIGMGAGYYDRCFAFLNLRMQWRRPHLLGVAFDCQRVARLEPARWDVPLDALVTESGVHWFNDTE